MGLFIGKEGSEVTLTIDNGNFTQVNAYIGITPEINYNRKAELLRCSIVLNKTKADYYNGVKGFVCDQIVPYYIELPCSLSEIAEGTGGYLFEVAYQKLLIYLKQVLNTEDIFNDQV